MRIVGIDSPERGECGHREATEVLTALIAGRPVQLSGGARDDRDRYGRLLCYLDIDGVDVGEELIRSGWANARYDSRDGYGHHLREDTYIATDVATEHRCATTPATTTHAPSAGGTGPRFATCADAKAAGYGPYQRGEPEYTWYRDRDGDGTACE